MDVCFVMTVTPVPSKTTVSDRESRERPVSLAMCAELGIGCSNLNYACARSILSLSSLP
jgi:hypothetical protein